MPPRGSLVPGRFLALTAHLVLLVQLGGGGNPPPQVLASLPPQFSPQELEQARRSFWGALGGSLVLLGVELVGFFSGVSMFHPGQGLLSLGAHAGAALTLTLTLLDPGDNCGLWILFGLCSVPPAITELLLMLQVLGRGRRGM